MSMVKFTKIVAILTLEVVILMAVSFVTSCSSSLRLFSMNFYYPQHDGRFTLSFNDPNDSITPDNRLSEWEFNPHVMIGDCVHFNSSGWVPFDDGTVVKIHFFLKSILVKDFVNGRVKEHTIYDENEVEKIAVLNDSLSYVVFGHSIDFRYIIPNVIRQVVQNRSYIPYLDVEINSGFLGNRFYFDPIPIFGN